MRTNRPLRVLIAEDHAIMRDGLISLLTKEESVEIIAEAGNGQDALHLAVQLAPDLVIMDLSMPGTNGTEAISLIKRRLEDVKIVALTVHNTEEYVRATLDAGANGYVLKEDSHHDLLAAINQVFQGRTYLSPGICNHVVSGYLSQPVVDQESNDPPPSWSMLSIREREVLKLVAEGQRNKDISGYLSISVKTVEKHRANVMRKLDLHSVSELTVFAMQHNLMSA